MRITSLWVVGAIAGTLVRPALVEASCVPGFDYAIFAADTIHIQGNATTDSYDSSQGPYATTNACGEGDIGTNAVSGGAVTIQSASAEVCGDVFVGAGSSPASVIQQHHNAKVTGSKSAQQANKSLPNATLPSLPNAAGQNPTFKNTAGVLLPGFTYTTVTCQNGSLRLIAGKYIVSQLVLQSNCELEVGNGAVEVYFTSGLHLQGGVIANASGVAGNLVFYGGPNASNVHLQGGASAAFAVYAPTAQCHLQGNADVYGAIVCEDAHVQGNAHIHYDRALATVSGGGFECSANEVSRATPIAAKLDNEDVIVQGTFEVGLGSPSTIGLVGDVASFSFPHIKGHVRARTAASISTTATSFSSGTVLFDAGAPGKIPPANASGCNSFDGSCRHVFTVTQTPNADGVSLRPARVQLDNANAATIGSLIAPASEISGIGSSQWTSIVQKVLGGKLGGVDRSTVAVIGPSTIAGDANRPTIVYFGATDGMLHAVCASVGGSTASESNICPSLGTEIWAFMPRVQLPLVRKNLARVDGSVRVVDAFGDFDGTGQRSFRTILTFQTGYAHTLLGGAAVYALDVTDPANPKVVWEHTKPITNTTFALGTGLTLHAGPTLIQDKPVNLVVAATTNGGSGGTGIVATAIDMETGTRRWQMGYRYPSPPRGSVLDMPLPLGIPGGAVGVDLARTGFVSDIVMGDLYGNLWRLDAATGASRTGAGVPLFQFSSNKKPIGAVPAIYSDGNRQFAVFASGGYVDPILATWATGTQALVGIDLTVDGPYPIAETSTKLAIKQNLTAGDRGFAQVLVVGDELFVTTDSTDVNALTYGTGTANTGRVLAYDLGDNSTSTFIVRGGAGSLAHVGTDLYSSSSSRQQELSNAASSTTGPVVDSAVTSRFDRKLWLRLQ